MPRYRGVLDRPARWRSNISVDSGVRIRDWAESEAGHHLATDYLSQVGSTVAHTDWVPGVQDAADAAVRVATTLGLDVGQPVMMRSTNNVVTWLKPAPVVAKVARKGRNQLGWEQTVAVSALRHGGPVVGPSELIRATVHAWGDWEMTFWPYHPQDEEHAPDASDLGRALGQLHGALDLAAMTDTPDLPNWDEAPRDVLRRLDDRAFARPLAQADRDLLRRALDRVDEITFMSAHERALHGSPHAYNVVVAEGEVRFIDLETACRGPVEWDLCHLDPAVADAYAPGHSPAALTVARLVVSAMVSALCWEAVNRGPDMRWHAEHHLTAVRAAMA